MVIAIDRSGRIEGFEVVIAIIISVIAIIICVFCMVSERRTGVEMDSDRLRVHMQDNRASIKTGWEDQWGHRHTLLGTLVQFGLSRRGPKAGQNKAAHNNGNDSIPHGNNPPGWLSFEYRSRTNSVLGIRTPEKASALQPNPDFFCG